MTTQGRVRPRAGTMAEGMGRGSFPPAGIRFLKELERNNTVEWFHANKDRYTEWVRAPMLQLVEAVNASLRTFAPAYLVHLPGALSRPNRDTRFSKDKAPYRTDIAAVFPRNGLEKHRVAGFFLRVSAAGTEVLGGVYMPGPDELRALRAWLDRHHAEFSKLVSDPALRRCMGALQGDRLQRVPKPFPQDHPAASLLRHTQLFFRHILPAAVTTSPALEQEVTRRFRTMTPFVAALDRALAT